MKKIIISLISATCFLHYVVDCSPTLDKCKYGDTDCIKQFLNNVVKSKSNGYSKFKIPQIDPLHSDEMIFKQNGPINLKIRLYDIDFIGLSNSTFEKVSGFNKDPNGSYELHFKIPSLDVYSSYEVNGQILVLPVTAKGHSNVTIIELDGACKFTGKGVEKNGKTYLKIKDFDYVQDIKEGNVAFTKAYIGNQLLADTTVKFQNEHWMGILDELELSMRQSFGKELRILIENVFDNVPYDELFQQ